MKNHYLLFIFLLGAFFLDLCLGIGFSQQQDVPEPVFLNFSIQPLYIPAYHGRDPFRPINNLRRSPQISIAELDYHGVILMSNQPMALFTWRGNSTMRYTLKNNKLFSEDQEIDGVVGEIVDSEVILTQGDKKIVYPRRK